jgi:hypothetical protein
VVLGAAIKGTLKKMPTFLPISKTVKVSWWRSDKSIFRYPPPSKVLRRKMLEENFEVNF